MKFFFIAPGEIPIPPPGWGALETITWSYYQEMTKRGEEVFISNEQDPYKIIEDWRRFQPDVIHLRYGKHWELMPMLKAKFKVATSYDGSFLSSYKMHQELVTRFFTDCWLFTITNMERQAYLNFGVKNKIVVNKDGVDGSQFKVAEGHSKQALYLGKIDARKRQAIYQRIGINCFFVGNCADASFDQKAQNYLGTWNREQVYANMAKFDSLVLLSQQELQPLVCMEAMSAGLGLVISEAASENLDRTKPWITIIPHERLFDPEYINAKIEENSKVASALRKEIVEYSKEFSWPKIIDFYLGQFK